MLNHIFIFRNIYTHFLQHSDVILFWFFLLFYFLLFSFFLHHHIGCVYTYDMFYMRNVFEMTLRQGYNTRTHTLSLTVVHYSQCACTQNKMNGILCGVVFRMTYDFYMFWNEKVRCHRSRIFNSIFFFFAFALHTFSTSLALYRQYIKIRYCL